MLEYALSLHYLNNSIPDVLAMNIEEAAIYIAIKSRLN